VLYGQLDQLRTANRAFVVVVGLDATPIKLTPDKANWYISPKFENTGATPVKNLTVTANYCPITEPLPNEFSFPNFEHKNIRIPLGPKATTTMWPYVVDSQIMALIANRKIMFYVWEQASYNDRVGNNEQHVTRYCFLINAARGDVVSGNAQIGFSPCPAHNCSDGECENDNQTSDTEEAIRDARARCTLNIIVQENK